MKCLQCGNNIPEGAHFCPNCGTPVTSKQGGKCSSSQKEQRKVSIPQIIVILSLSLVVFTLILTGWNLSRNKVVAPVGDDNPSLTPTPTSTPIPTSTPTPTPTPTLTPTPTPLPTPTFTPVPVAVPETSVQMERATSDNEVDTIIIYGGIQAPASDFLFPESSSSYLTYDRMNQMLESSSSNRMHSLSQLGINELYARYGFTFTSNQTLPDEARARFNGKGWYQSAQSICPVEPGDWSTLVENYFNEYERANFYALNEWQKDHGVYY